MADNAAPSRYGAVTEAYGRLATACPNLRIINIGHRNPDDPGDLDVEPFGGTITGRVAFDEGEPTTPRFEVSLDDLDESQVRAVANALLANKPVPSSERWNLPETVKELKRLLDSPPLTLLALQGGGLEEGGVTARLDHAAMIARGDLDVLIRHFDQTPPPPVPEKALVVIELFGGNCRAVYSDARVEAVLIDWDNIQEGDKAGSCTVDPLAAMSGETLEAFNNRE